ncbi:hypothetical protein [Shimazuella kribbensis]|uniref:hypothetical protein n=1 Tax=Shimazuella kribbensis TaxID=139808 RepID=UPI00040D23DE|nr:hypothetical protein [Shimazuella kribbensis]
MRIGTMSTVPFLPPFITEEWVIFTSGNIASGKDQAGMLIANSLWYDFGLRCVEVDPDGQFPEGWDTTSNPMDHFHYNREKATALFLSRLYNPVPGQVLLFQSGGATLDGEHGRRTLVNKVLYGENPRPVLHFHIETPIEVCKDRNKRRRLAGKRFTPEEEVNRCAENVKKNFDLLSVPRYDAEGNLCNVGMRLRYLTEKKYEIVRHDETIVPVYYHWNPQTNDPYLTPWVD